MSKGIIITRPNHDLVTTYLFYWSQKIIEQAERKNFKIFDLAKKRANAKEFVGIIKKISPSLVVINGHGSASMVTGYNNEPILESNSNSELLKGTVAYARSCQSAKKLGSAAVKNGAKAYIGYSEDFFCMFDEQKITRPLEDQTAKLFLEPSNAVPISLLKGNTAGEAINRSKKILKKNIRNLLTSESPQQEKDAVPYLLWNMNYQVCIGDEEARI
ncbi:MAG: hypothetical protein WAP74_03840 [Patescibacteria group bacterium]